MKVVFLFVFFSCTSFKSWWVVSWHFFSYLWASYTSCGTLLKTPRTICILPHLKLLNISNNKKPLTAAFSLACLKIRSRNEEAINSTRNKMDLLAKCFFTSYFIDVDTFYLFLNWFSTRVSNDWKYICGCRLYACIKTRKFKGLDSREITSLPQIKKVIKRARHFNHRWK